MGHGPSAPRSWGARVESPSVLRRLARRLTFPIPLRIFHLLGKRNPGIKFVLWDDVPVVVDP
jgi:hypothetical protein